MDTDGVGVEEEQLVGAKDSVLREETLETALKEAAKDIEGERLGV